MRRATRGQKVKGQGHTVTKTVTVASDHDRYSATLAGVGLRVDTTAYVF